MTKKCNPRAIKPSKTALYESKAPELRSGPDPACASPSPIPRAQASFPQKTNPKVPIPFGRAYPPPSPPRPHQQKE